MSIRHYVFLYARHLTNVLWYGVCLSVRGVRMYVASSTFIVGRISHELYRLGCSNLVCILHLERGRSLFIFKVKGQISRSLGLYKEFGYLYPCGQVIASTMQSRLLQLSMYTSYGKRKKPIYFRSKVKFQGHWTFTKNSRLWIFVGRI